jgi:aspartyl-tRNA(Asn)/glutamyl-tRNA(Gln) amidotransferase subunit C
LAAISSEGELACLRGSFPVAITREEVLHVASLAWLALTDEEIERLTTELDKILEAVGIVSELDLADVPPTSHPLDLVNVSAEDVPVEPLPREAALANAPDTEGGLFKVPAWRP